MHENCGDHAIAPCTMHCALQGSQDLRQEFRRRDAGDGLKLLRFGAGLFSDQDSGVCGVRVANVTGKARRPVGLEAEDWGRGGQRGRETQGLDTLGGSGARGGVVQ